MERIFEIAFRINGELSGSFGAAISAAQKQMQNLNRRMTADNQRAISRAAKLQQDLMKLSSVKAATEQYKALQKSVQDNSVALVQARLKSAQMKQAYQDQYNQVEKMRQSYDRLKAVFKDNKNSMTADQRVAMKSQIQAAKEELKAQENVLKSMSRENTGQSRKTLGLESQLSRQRSELAQLQASLRSAGVSLSDMAAHERQLQNAINQTTAALERQQRLDMHRQNFSNAQQNMSNAASNFQDAMSTAGKIMSPIKSAIDEAVSFEAAMSKVKALTQVKNIRAGDSTRVESEMAQLTAEIQRVGATTEFSQVEVARMAQKYAMSGWNKDQILAALSPAINVATATGERDVVKIADMLSDEMQALNLKAGGKINVGGKTYDAMKHMADVFTYATNQSNVDANAFHEAMKYNAPIATSAGVNMHEIAALNMVMANSAIKGSMGGTAGRSGILRLVAPPKQAAKALEELGYSASDAQKAVAEAGAEMQSMGINEFDSVTTKIQKIQKALSGLSDQEKTAKLGKIFGTNGASGWAAIMAHYDDYIKYMKDFDSGAVEGWTDDTAKVMRDNTETNFHLLESAVSALATSFGNLFLPAVNEGLKGLTNFATGLQTFVQEHQDLAKAAGIAAAAVAGVIVAVAGFGVASASVQFLTSSFALLRTTLAGLSFANAASSITSFGTSLMTAARGAMALAFSPVGIALMALAAAGYYCYTHWSQVAPVFESLAGTLGGALQGAVTAISAAFENLGASVSRLGPAFSNIGGAIFSGLAVALNFVVNIAATVISTFANAIAAVISLFGGLGNAIASALAGDWGKAAEHFKNAFVNAGKFVVEAIKSLFGGLADTFTNFFKPLEIMGGFKSDKSTSGGGSFSTPQTPQPQQIDNSALIAAIANAVEKTQKQTPEADWSKVTAALSTAVESIKQDPKTDIAPQLQAISTAIESVKKENPNADTSKLESVLSAAMDKISAAQKDKADSAEIVKSVSTAIESLKAQNSEADLSKIEAAVSAAVEKSDSSENLAAAISTAIESTKQEQPELDLTPITEAIAAAQQAQSEQKSIEIAPVQEALNQAVVPFTEVGAATQMFNAEMTNAQAANAANNAEIQNSAAANAANNAQLQASQGALSGFNAALQSTNGGLASLASSSSSAASAISGLGSAASAAVSALQSAGSQAAAAVSAAAANIGKPAANFKGGIYPRGEFLTTFAEKSPEAAIPIDNSRRAIDLWTKTGQLLGQLPGNSAAIESTPQAQKISTIERAQRQRLEQVKIQYEAAKKAGALRSTQVEYDELGNIRGLNGLKDNVITKDDDLQVARAKKAAQMAEWRKTHSTRVEFLPNIPKSHSTRIESLPNIPKTHSTRIESPKVPKSIFSGRVQTPDFSHIPMTQTQPRTYDTGLNIGDIFGAIGERLGGEGIIPQLINNLPQQSDSSPIDLHFEINIQGNANAEDVEQGIRQSIPLLEETFERKLANYQHEQQRRSF